MDGVRTSSTGADSGGSGGAGGANVVALVDGSPVTWSELRPLLTEAAGGLVLEEIALERLLTREFVRYGLTLDNADIARERRLLIETLGEAAVTESERDAILRDIRRTRGLGDARFAGLMRRNAMLRKLVADDVQITDSTIEQAHQLRYGPRIPARIITTATTEQAMEALSRLRSGEAFGEVAARLSTDPSAARGGIIEPVNPSDPAYPQAFRAALSRAPVGTYTPAIALEQGFAILLREGDGAPEGGVPPIDTVREALERDVRMRQERLLMSALARQLIESARISVTDPSIDRSWRERTRR